MDPQSQAMPKEHGELPNTSASRNQNPSYDDLLGTIQYLLEEQKSLAQRLRFAERTVQELSQQAQYTNSLARNAQQSIALAGNRKTIDGRPDVGKPSTWIGGSWLAPSEDVLAEPEKTWQDGNAQGALNLAGRLLRRHSPTVSEDVHTNLFISAILRASGDLGQASKYAEDALVIAKDADSYLLAGKSEFHRGLCYIKQNRFAQAQWCLVLASHLEGHQEQIEANRIFAEERCRNSGSRDPARKLDLEYI